MGVVSRGVTAATPHTPGDVLEGSGGLVSLGARHDRLGPDPHGPGGLETGSYEGF